MAANVHTLSESGDSRRSERAIDPALLQALAAPAHACKLSSNPGRLIHQISAAQALQEASVLADVVSYLGTALLADPERDVSGSCFTLLAELLGERLDVMLEGALS